MYLLYSLLTAAGMVLLSPYFLIRALLRGKDLGNIPERLGWKFPRGLRQAAAAGAREKAIWIHAVSVGEVLAVLPLAKQLKQRYPRYRLVISTTTTTGQQVSRERMDFADAIFYFPLDWTGPVQRALKATQASIVLIVETEIWPNFLRECRRANVPVIFVNGRLSQRSFGGFLRALSYSGGLLRGFLAKILNDASLFLMQGAEDAARLLALGAPKERVIVTGNLKYDLAEPPESALSAWLEAELARGKRGPVLIAGSVMANEEAKVLGAFAGRAGISGCVADSRSPETRPIRSRGRNHFASGAAIGAAQRDFAERNFQRRARKTPQRLFAGYPGRTSGIYRLADAVFVGGSLVPVGGHKILEPAAFGKVPVYGPFMENFREMAAAFLDAGASIRVATAEELGSAWSGLLRDPERAARMGAAARELVDRNRGATQRVLSRIEKIMDAHGGLK